MRLTVLIITLLLSACSSVRRPAPAEDPGPPVRGGTLKVVAGSDVDHLSSTSGYGSSTLWMFRAFSRQLVAYPPAPDWNVASQVAADLADPVPSLENGGISPDGRTYTLHLRRGVFWDTSPPREVTAADSVLGMKLLCNPVAPTGAPGYYESTIAGMHEYCDAFSKVPGTVPDIRQFIDAHEIEGVHAADEFTVVMRLMEPAADFLNILAMPFASPAPVEYLNYLPDSPEFRQHTVSNGPYRITRYVPNQEYQFERNPVWREETDPLRPSYVDRINLVMGIDSQLGQLELEAGTADLIADHTTPVSALGSLIELGDPNLVLAPPGNNFSTLVYLVVNVVGPNNNSALTKQKVREAVAYAVDKTAIVQDWGGPKGASPARQAVMGGATGYQDGADRFQTPGDRGDPERARKLLAEAGFPNGIALKLAYPILSAYPMNAQSVQASLRRAGIDVTLTPYTTGDFWSRALPNAENARRGVWDIAVTGWLPDWYGATNGRAVIEPLFDGRHFGRNSMNYGGYNSDVVNTWIDRGSVALTTADSQKAWTAAAAKVMDDVGIIPLAAIKTPRYHSERTKNCRIAVFGPNCDITAVWLKGDKP